ncbi:outer membrane protein assembly factor BamE domain-containing protein [Comamonas faecalis]|uniref:outer membrane protein assembly factor BamE domain-containing protein n=1 Tax=Comamonas faecalis TaxID=1387849 RepID=UPI000C9F0CD7
MSALVRWGACCGAVVLVATLAGCAGSGNRVLNAVTPYTVEVVQGNFVSREQVRALQPGMSRQQVREILGTPLVTSVFHGDRWEYIFTIRRANVENQVRHLTVFFKDNVLDRHEGDEMPTEAEFVASISTRIDQPKVPPLEATEAQLARYPKAQAQPEAPQPEPPTGHYPPLESSAR